jgi:SAM-dependent methyltransferase
MIEQWNRPMLEEDVKLVEKNEPAQKLRKMVSEYTSQALPVMNGSFEYSNLREGPLQQLTCHPYRLWEYSSLFQAWRPKPGARVLDVGGAASPLPYFLAEQGWNVTATDLQTMLVEVCNEVARQRRLSLEAVSCDITRHPAEWSGHFSLVTFISVVEHIAPAVRPAILRAIYEVLEPGGLLYMTFDYGSFTEATHYTSDESERSEAIDDLAPLADQLLEIGFRFCGNDPRTLPPAILARKASPGFQAILRNHRVLRGPIDVETPWKSLAGYVVRRILRPQPKSESRLARHNFFRLFLEKPSEGRN